MLENFGQLLLLRETFLLELDSTDRFNHRRPLGPMDKATNATARAQTLFKAAISSTVSSAAVQLITRLQPVVQVADMATTQAAIYMGKDPPEPKLKQTSDEGVILEQHEDVQIQRTPDGKTMMRFTNRSDRTHHGHVRGCRQRRSDTIYPTWKRRGLLLQQW